MHIGNANLQSHTLNKSSLCFVCQWLILDFGSAVSLPLFLLDEEMITAAIPSGVKTRERKKWMGLCNYSDVQVYITVDVWDFILLVSIS